MAAGCGGGDEGGSGARAINWYVFNEPGGAFEEAVDDLQQAGERRATRSSSCGCPTDADQQRELVVRRLAAEDSDIDIIGMDVIWTAEFAEAEWILPWEGGAEQAAAREGKLEGPLETVEYQDKLWALPVHHQHPAALVPQGPRASRRPSTWDEMIDQAEQSGTRRSRSRAAATRGYGVGQLADRLAPAARSWTRTATSRSDATRRARRPRS